ncbi:hypothetical protein A3D83_03570 [Candidatus Daviesbacteria bacterium RIFCSPHIGHO2_02_FULL_41_10]|uniref:Uncharacterized protein n=1 Tax=Candidatus Daviesbacteria bacterium RIFCSPHIGHO2_02_FULL_41_10 TaxID=1797774 RepID=A0A1F5JUQ6_9BACT|nr:MAG: hypothetical protein A3D83_03570 [Candidatus Daviesbacteria bacterium RIFCSPHIGHO2_02_FULL_41_10]
MDKTSIYIFALAAHGLGISGSDRIFIEFARRWAEKYPVDIYVWEEGFQMCRRQHLEISNVKFLISKMDLWSKFGFVVNYLARIVDGVRIGLTLKVENSKNTVVYSASEFWMDSLPAFILKTRYPNIKWAAAWYQTAPNLWTGFAEGTRENRYRLNSFLYWISQFLIKPIIRRSANFILVNNNEEKKQFQKATVVLGAVDLKQIRIWKSKLKNLPKIYDGVFQGRFHPQKGVIELIDIWKKVVDKKPGARLIMIGDGPLMESVKRKVKSEKLEKNIILTGYLFDGEEKYRIFAQSKIVAHPSFYDSGGMAAAEAMAFGLPCVGFDLKSYESYYPKGMIKVPLGNLEGFAGEILNLLSDDRLYTNIAKDAQDMIGGNWSWEKRADDIFRLVVE